MESIVIQDLGAVGMSNRTIADAENEYQQQGSTIDTQDLEQKEKHVTGTPKDSPLKYKYQPITDLDGIRLIELLPSSNPSSLINCRLIHTRISLCDNRDIYGHYTALSYVWGSPQKTRPVHVDNATLWITESLHSALQDLRDATRPLMMWADAMCINQEDWDEKGLQIQLMGQIYAGALHTVIYLGPAEIDGAEIKCLRAAEKNPRDQSPTSLSPILEKEWFQRVWTFQEIVFSVSPWIQCGRFRIKWQILIRSLTKKRTQLPRDINAMNNAWSTAHPVEGNHSLKPGGYLSVYYFGFVPWHPGRTLVDLLLQRSGYSVTDPRDMIYAHLGFVDDSMCEDLQVDYKRGTEYVYRRCAKYIKDTYGIGPLLMCASLLRKSGRCGDLPSWVPDWTSKSLYQESEMRDTVVPLICRPEDGPGQYWDATLLVDDCKVLVHLTQNYDVVTAISSEIPLEKIPNQTRQKVAETLTLLGIAYTRLHGSFDYKLNDTTEKKLQVLNTLWELVYQLWRDVIKDDEILPPRKKMSAEALEELRYDKMSFKLRERGPTSMTVMSTLLLAYGNQVTWPPVSGMALARTASGKLALVPSSTKKGDIVSPAYSKMREARLGLPRYYIFRPLESPNYLPSLDTEIQNAMTTFIQNSDLDPTPIMEQVKGRKWPYTREHEVLIEPEDVRVYFEELERHLRKEKRVMHVEFRDECLLDREACLEPDGSYEANEEVATILAIH